MKTVLVADPEPFLRDVLRIRLAGAGYRVLLAENGADLVRLAREGGIDLILMDVLLPTERDGYQACQTVKSDPRTASIPVMILSREARRPEIAFQYSTWAVARHAKPFVPREILRGVHRTLAGPAPEAPA